MAAIFDNRLPGPRKRLQQRLRPPAGSAPPWQTGLCCQRLRPRRATRKREAAATAVLGEGASTLLRGTWQASRASHAAWPRVSSPSVWVSVVDWPLSSQNQSIGRPGRRVVDRENGRRRSCRWRVPFLSRSIHVNPQSAHSLSVHVSQSSATRSGPAVAARLLSWSASPRAEVSRCPRACVRARRWGRFAICHQLIGRKLPLIQVPAAPPPRTSRSGRSAPTCGGVHPPTSRPQQRPQWSRQQPHHPHHRQQQE